MKYFLHLILIIFFFIACSTSKGNLFERVSETEKDSSSSEYDDSDYLDEDQDQADTEDELAFYTEEDTSLYIESYPDGAEVYVDGSYYGVTPLVINTLAYGSYKVEIKMQDYYILTTWIDYAEDRRFFDFTLEQITGYINIQTWPPNTQIMLGDIIIFNGITEVPIGNYRLYVQAFGYRDYEKYISISENMTTNIEIELEEVDFEISNLRTGRAQFNPQNPGVLGTSTIYFEVSSFGSGKATIIDKQEKEVSSHQFRRFTTWEQSFTWTGRDSQGAPLADGTYEIIIVAVDERTGKQITVSINVIIDSSLTINYRSLFSGSAGLLYAPCTEVLPPFTLQCSVLVLAHVHPQNDENYFRAPTALGVRLGLPANSEINLMANIILESISEYSLWIFPVI